MGFVWNDVSAGQDIDDADPDEMVTNLDTIYAALGINYPACAGAAWVEQPVNAGDPVMGADYDELQDRTDFADDNKCPLYYGTNQADEKNVQETGYNSGDWVVEYTTQNPLYGDHCTGNWGANLAGNLAAQHSYYKTLFDCGPGHMGVF